MTAIMTRTRMLALVVLVSLLAPVLSASAATQRVYADPDFDGYGTANNFRMISDVDPVPEGYIAWISGHDADNCPALPNPSQTDTDGDGTGDICDPDTVFEIKGFDVKVPESAPGVPDESGREFVVTYSKPVMPVSLKVTVKSTGAHFFGMAHQSSSAPQMTYTLNVWNLEPSTQYEYVVEGKDAANSATIARTGGVFTTASGPRNVTGAFDPKDATDSTPNINTDKALVAASARPCVAGTRVRASTPAVYYCGVDGKRYVFPNERVYASWYQDFNGIVVLSDAALAQIPLGGNVTYRPGRRMIKIQSDPRVYAVARGGILRLIQNEAVARTLYGDDWNKMIDDVSDAFWVNYQIGEPISP